MAHNIQLPCDGQGECMRCKTTPPTEETLTCCTCGTPWHVACLSKPPETMASAMSWLCPDCSGTDESVPPAVAAGESGSLVAAIRAIEADESLTERQKAKKRQELLTGKVEEDEDDGKNKKGKEKQKKDEEVKFDCCFCLQLPERPVSTPCGHNFCLKCFQKWIGQGKRSCAKCRKPIPSSMASQPRINSMLVAAIRAAKLPKVNDSRKPVNANNQYLHNQDRPDEAFTTERARKSGKANAASGKIFVTVPPDHFGPIPAENDPVRNQGVLVGENWSDRLACRQWGVHLPHVAGIAGQSNYGAQSVALSGGYEDDEDHGEWFLYTGSGGRDLSGNRRTNKIQSSDQTFEKYNEALRVSCKKGYPVRVVRSHKEKRSNYAPHKGVRYDGVYRIEKCWSKAGVQGFLVCRYLFVRCDNEPAPWTSDVIGDRPRPLPVIGELEVAKDITERKGSPAWDFDEEDGCWKWKKPPPMSRKPMRTGNPEDIKRARKAFRQVRATSVKEKLLKEFSCRICRNVMNFPITTPCAHNFCKACLEGAFAGKSLMRERSRGGRTLRAQKNVMLCPSCPTDISEFLQNPQVNRELMDVIESLKNQKEEAVDDSEDSSDDETCDTDEEAEDDDVERAPKRAKTETGESSLSNDNDGNEIKTYAEMSDVSDDASPIDGNEKAKANLGMGLVNEGAGVEAEKMNRKSQEVADEGDNSPSSTLLLQGSDEDLE